MRTICLLFVMVFLASCARVESNVQNFSNLPMDYKGKRVAVLGYPKEIDKSLEWNSYKPTFEREFQKQGFVLSDAENADYIAFVTYGIGAPQTSTQIGSVPIYGQTGGGTTTHSGTVSSYSGGSANYYGSSYTMPTYGVVGSSTYSYNTTSYTRTVAINLVEKVSNRKIFESKATSTGSCGIIGKVINEIAEGMFKKFPSGSGRVVVHLKGKC
jgi:hypothetical protein